MVNSVYIYGYPTNPFIVEFSYIPVLINPDDLTSSSHIYKIIDQDTPPFQEFGEFGINSADDASLTVKNISIFKD